MKNYLILDYFKMLLINIFRKKGLHPFIYFKNIFFLSIKFIFLLFFLKKKLD